MSGEQDELTFNTDSKPELYRFTPTRMGKIHAARIENSPRLQRLAAFLADGQWHSTREIVHGAEVMAVNSAISELRANGIEVECRAAETMHRRGVYEYRKKIV